MHQSDEQQKTTFDKNTVEFTGQDQHVKLYSSHMPMRIGGSVLAS